MKQTNAAFMPSFWDQITRLFRAAEASSPRQPVVHEVIVRTDGERADYGRWKESLVMRRLLNWLADQYAVFNLSPDNIDEAVDFLKTPSSQGFVVHFHKTNYTAREAIHFFDYLCERVCTRNYKLQLSDVKVYNRQHWVERLEQHYLKPRPKLNEAGKALQQFGNVLIALEFRNDRPHQLRFKATTYHDHNYLPPDDFRQLMQVALE